MLKHYFVNLTIFVNDYVKHVVHYIKAPDELKAGQCALYCESHNNNLEWVSNTMVVDVDMIYKVSGIQQIDQSLIDALETQHLIYLSTYNSSNIKESKGGKL